MSTKYMHSLLNFVALWSTKAMVHRYGTDISDLLLLNKSYRVLAAVA